MIWVQTNWRGILEAASAAYVLLGAINGLLPHGGAASTLIGRIMDVLAPLARSDSPGTLKMIGMQSRPPTVAN